MVDAVQSSKFITAQKSKELICKVESLASVHQAKDLQRQVRVANRIKTMNESIYYNVDAIHEAISKGKQVDYLYFEWVPGENGRLERQFRRSGSRYRVSPWALTWDDENYLSLIYILQMPQYQGDHLLASLFGGALIGIGLGVTFLGESSTGGVDISCLVLQKKFPHMKISSLVFLTDMVIIAFGAVAYQTIESAPVSYTHLHSCGGNP